MQDVKMDLCEVGIEFIQALFKGVVEGMAYVKTILVFILDANYNAMSKILAFLWNLSVTVGAIANFVFLVCYTLLVCLSDFVIELLNFFIAFLQLLWKLLILVYSLLDLLFHSLESIFYFLWSGGQWTAQTIKISSQNLTENGISTWKYFVLSIKELTSSIIGGFTTVGILSKELFWWIYGCLCTSYDYIFSAVYYVDETIRDIGSYVFDSTYCFLSEYIMNMPKEAYLGIIMCCMSYVIIKSVVHCMYVRGLTFPLFSWNAQSSLTDNESEDYDDYDGRMAEFSDDDLIDLTLDGDDYSVESESSDEDDDISDEDGELEVDTSDDESVAASESEMSEINIQLPDLHDQIRRSVTPSRFAKEMTPTDLHRAIESEKERRMCVVCQDRTKSVLILPCRHMCLCVECGNQIARTRARNRRVCPLCRTRIRTIMNVYV